MVIVGANAAPVAYDVRRNVEIPNWGQITVFLSTSNATEVQQFRAALVSTQLTKMERAALAAASDPYRYVEKRKPIPDPQDTGLIYGKKKGPTRSDD